MKKIFFSTFFLIFTLLIISCDIFSLGLKSLSKEDFNEFEIPEKIYLTSLNYDTGLKSAPGEKNSIIEALKLRDINNLENNNLLSSSGRDKIIKFRQFY